MTGMASRRAQARGDDVDVARGGDQKPKWACFLKINYWKLLVMQFFSSFFNDYWKKYKTRFFFGLFFDIGGD